MQTTTKTRLIIAAAVVATLTIAVVVAWPFLQETFYRLHGGQ